MVPLHRVGPASRGRSNGRVPRDDLGSVIRLESLLGSPDSRSWIRTEVPLLLRSWTHPFHSRGSELDGVSGSAPPPGSKDPIDAVLPYGIRLLWHPEGLRTRRSPNRIARVDPPRPTRHGPAIHRSLLLPEGRIRAPHSASSTPKPNRGCPSIGRPPTLLDPPRTEVRCSSIWVGGLLASVLRGGRMRCMLR